ncbi:MAG: hypothetical protein WD004_03510 [Actinomycetota bacterium]
MKIRKTTAKIATVAMVVIVAALTVGGSATPAAATGKNDGPKGLTVCVQVPKGYPIEFSGTVSSWTVGRKEFGKCTTWLVSGVQSLTTQIPDGLVVADLTVKGAADYTANLETGTLAVTMGTGRVWVKYNFDAIAKTVKK